MQTRLFSIELRDEHHIVLCRGRGRDVAAALGFQPQTQTQIATAVSEIARNAVQYGGGGTAEFSLVSDDATKSRQAFAITIRDRGAGISQLTRILSGKYVSTTGLGLGIIGAKRIIDELEVQTSPDGTTVTMRENLPPGAAYLSPVALRGIVDRIVAAQPQNHSAEVQLQNQELMRTLQEVESQQSQLTILHNELVDTNRGVVALYHELDSLHQIGTLIASRLELQPLLEDILRASSQLLRASIGIAFHREADEDNLQALATHGLDLDGLRALSFVTLGAIFGDNVAVRIISFATERIPEQPWTAVLIGNSAASYLAVPITDAAGHVITVLVFAPIHGQSFDENVERLMSSVATQLSVGVQNAILYRELQKAGAAKDRFLAILSHELRTPLNPVYLVAQAFEKDPRFPSALLEDAALLRRNVELEIRLIDDLLDLTRISRGKVLLALEQVRTDAILEEVAAICASDAEAKGVRLVLDLSAADSYVSADPIRLKQLFWNLAKNAIKFTPGGGEVLITSRLPAEGTVVVELIDSGRGIDSATLPKIFEAFEQGDAETNVQFGGLGLGLAITKSLVDAHGGHITAFSLGQNQGTTFIVTLPVIATELVNRALPLQNVPAVSPPLTRHANILLVDDHEDTLRSMTRILERFGYRVTATRSLASARKAEAEQFFDILISDIGLPDGSGLRLPAELLKNRKLPCIAVSGFGAETDLQKSKEAGFAAHLTKPVRIEQLIEHIDQLLRNNAWESQITADVQN